MPVIVDVPVLHWLHFKDSRSLRCFSGYTLRTQEAAGGASPLLTLVKAPSHEKLTLLEQCALRFVGDFFYCARP